MTLRALNLVGALALAMIAYCPQNALGQNTELTHNYTQAELRYMMKTGFDPNGYDWSNSQINNLLDSALLLRKGNGALIGLGALVISGSTALGLVSFASFIGSERGPSSSDQRIIATRFLIGTAIGTGLILLAAENRSKARTKVVKANGILRPFRRKIKKEDFNNFFKQG